MKDAMRMNSTKLSYDHYTGTVACPVPPINTQIIVLKKLNSTLICCDNHLVTFRKSLSYNKPML